ncbi:protein ecdysoneless homolog isoform X2 [Brienomyrus brachyistius]|uniref:protein ecdysoneless homolog isoform X2 n=1 Tax=Brienomyrus brachyistius TaxID=42636 RepID=UPI0020B1D863|nr:protein ecdysoneless homolog isoform X2 [Brienomyrus brachyistius]
MDALRRPAVLDDVVQYQLFLATPDSSKPRTRNTEYLQQLVQKILAEFAPLLVQYIWQQEPFNINYYPEKGGVPAYIGGSTKYGDNVEDEWFIVYLLQQITLAFPELAARVQDNDGEFLLIEAANYLPKWLNPESSENRVFFYRGELHILPVPSQAGDMGWPKHMVPSEEEALAFLVTHREACLASSRIRSAVRKKIEGYPEKIRNNLHRAHCFVPAGVAAVLARRPDLIAPAVSAFYLRDPLDLRACRTFRTFPPETRVLTSVLFTRCLYAQLQQQHFTPDRHSRFILPLRSQPHYRAHELGMKLAHGFEILCSKCSGPSSEQDVPVSGNPLWKGFIESLEKSGYFRGELEGSAHHKELMSQAESFFKQSVTPPHRSPGEEVLQVLQSSPYSIEEMKEQEANLPPEDSDSWLDISPQELDRLLEETTGFGTRQSNLGQDNKQEGAKYDEASYSLVAVTQGVKNFIKTVSSHEGAEFPWSHSHEPFSFDPSSMANTLEKLLGGNAEELDSDDLEDDSIDDDDDDDDDDDEVNEGTAVPEGRSAKLGGETGAEDLGSLRRYMEEMDHELKDTNIGQSFCKAAMDKSGVAEAFAPEEDEIQPLNVDLNLVANLLESLSSQAGLAGPASSLLQSMGVHLPPNADQP